MNNYHRYRQGKTTDAGRRPAARPVPGRKDTWLADPAWLNEGADAAAVRPLDTLEDVKAELDRLEVLQRSLKPRFARVGRALARIGKEALDADTLDKLASLEVEDEQAAPAPAADTGADAGSKEDAACPWTDDPAFKDLIADPAPAADEEERDAWKAAKYVTLRVLEKKLAANGMSEMKAMRRVAQAEALLNAFRCAFHYARMQRVMNQKGGRA